MEISMKASSRKISFMGLENTRMQMEVFIRESGRTISSMERLNNVVKMEPFILEGSEMEWKAGMV